MKKCDKISKIMHDNFYKEREFALDVIEVKENIRMDETNTKMKNDFSHKINVGIYLIIIKKKFILVFTWNK